MLDPDPPSVQQSMRSQQSGSVLFEEYLVLEAFSLAGESVPDPSSETRHDTTPTVMETSLLVRKVAETLHLNLELLSLLVHELGGDWSDHGF